MYNSWHDFWQQLVLWLVANVSVVGIGTYLGKLFLTSSVNKKLETHKSGLQKQLEERKSELALELAQESEYLKHEHQKLAQEFERYSSKRHEVYAQVYQSVVITYGMVMNFLEHRNRVPDLEGRTKEEVEEFLSVTVHSSATVRRLIDLWENPKVEFEHEIQKQLDLIVHNETWNQWEKARDEWLLAEIYLSDTISELIRELLIDGLRPCLEQKTFLKMNIPINLFEGYRDSNLLKERSSILVNQIKERMKDELMVGYLMEANEQFR